MTHASIDRFDLLGEVESAIRGKFSSEAIENVLLNEQIDGEGNRVLVITVVFKGSTEGFLEKKPIGLTRFLRKKLLKLDEGAFPLLSFISAADFAA